MPTQYKVQTEVEALSAQNRDTSARLSDQRVAMYGSSRTGEVNAALSAPSIVGRSYMSDTLQRYYSEHGKNDAFSPRTNQERTPFNLSDSYMAQKILNTDGLVSYWPLNEPSGTNARDYKSSNNGTNTSATTGIAGQSGNSYQFDGASGEVDCGSASEFDNLSALTVMFLMNPVSIGENNIGSVVTKNLASENGWFIHINDSIVSEQLRFGVHHVTADLVRGSAEDSITFGVWQHIAVTWNGSATATNAKIYINGIEESSYQTTTNGVGDRVADEASSLRIGNISADSATFDGKIQHVALFNEVLTGTQILDLARISGVA